jgi:hypothetical protein
LISKEHELIELNKLYDENLNEKTEMSKLNLTLNEEKETLLTENTMINNDLLKVRQEIEEQNEQFSKLRESYELNTL